MNNIEDQVNSIKDSERPINSSAMNELSNVLDLKEELAFLLNQITNVQSLISILFSPEVQEDTSKRGDTLRNQIAKKLVHFSKNQRYKDIHYSDIYSKPKSQLIWEDSDKDVDNQTNND
jgi:hypothetical protein